MIEKLFKELEKIEKLVLLREKLDRLQKLLDSPLAPLLREVVDYTYSTNRKYRIRLDEKQFPENYVPQKPARESLDETWNRFKKLLEFLQTSTKRNVTEVKEFLDSVPSPEYVKWFIRIINRDLKIGVGEESIKKLFKSVVEVPPIMLANLYSPRMKLPDEVYVEPKYDGVRIVIIQRKDTLIVLTRNGKRNSNIEDLIEEKCGKLPEGVYDGEAFAGNWNDTMSMVSSLDLKKPSKKLKLYIFDYLTIEEWDRRECSLPYEKRRARLLNIFKHIKCDPLVPTPSIRCKSDEIYVWYEKYTTKYKFEGVIIKDPQGLYRFSKRTNEWLKLKERDIKAYKIIGVERGKGKYSNVLGALIVQSSHDKVTFKVGGGFTDQQRKEFWERRNELIGQCVEVIVFPSKQKTSKAAFPVFYRLRLDLGGKC